MNPTKTTTKKLLLKPQKTDFLWHKTLGGPDHESDVALNATREPKELWCMTVVIENNTKSLAQYCESELRGNNLLLIETAFF